MIEHQIHNSYGNYTYNAYFYTDRVWAEHFHKNFELIYVTRGACSVTVDREEIGMQKGELLLLSPYRIHSFVVPADAEIWVGVFSKDFIRGFAAKHGETCFSKFRCDAESEAFLASRLFVAGMPPLYLTKACLYLVCDACLARATVSELLPSHGFRSRVIEHLSSHLLENLTLRSTAAALGYEYHYFSRLFHECFGINFKEFINLLRFDYACECLEKDAASVTSLAGTCGFQSIRNFNRIFKELSGKTPSEYRALHSRARDGAEALTEDSAEESAMPRGRKGTNGRS